MRDLSALCFFSLIFVTTHVHAMRLYNCTIVMRCVPESLSQKAFKTVDGENHVNNATNIMLVENLYMKIFFFLPRAFYSIRIVIYFLYKTKKNRKKPLKRRQILQKNAGESKKKHVMLFLTAIWGLGIANCSIFSIRYVVHYENM